MERTEDVEIMHMESNTRIVNSQNKDQQKCKHALRLISSSGRREDRAGSDKYRIKYYLKGEINNSSQCQKDLQNCMIGKQWKRYAEISENRSGVIVMENRCSNRHTQSLVILVADHNWSTISLGTFLFSTPIDQNNGLVLQS